MSASDVGLWQQVLGPDFAAMPLAVRRVHSGLEAETFSGRARVRGQGGPAGVVRRLAGMPGPGRYPAMVVDIIPANDGEAWTRAFGGRRFSSRIHALSDGAFEERVGALAFRIAARPAGDGFDWVFRSWRIGPFPLPRILAPTIRARSFGRDGVYRFRVVIAHPWTGLIVAYAGRLEANETAAGLVRPV